MAPYLLLLPNLASHCPFTVRFNPHQEGIYAQTKGWFFDGNDSLLEKQCETFNGLNSTLLASVCYPDAGRHQMRILSDFLAYLFLLDVLSDEFDTCDTASFAAEVLNSFYHPTTFESPSQVAHMTKE